tara:strand:+ start:239 stop:568 length:330 start_codon:yes stop_codon:yes gene_type:complete
MSETFFEIVFEDPPTELQLSTELKCREVMKSNDNKKIKEYCCSLLRNQSRCDAVIAGALGKIAELESKLIIQEKLHNKSFINKIFFLIQQKFITNKLEKLVKEIVFDKP